MTATEELRRMLDERGVEWWIPVQMEGTEFTRWCDANNVQWTASEAHGSRKLRIGANSITPEQAITATLGEERTCTLEVNTSMTAVMCSKCNFPMPSGMDLLGVYYCPHCGKKVANAWS